MAFDTETTLPSPTGARLHLNIMNARSAELAVVHVNHGLSEHSGRYARFAASLADAGFHVYAHDHRGHGHSTAPDAEQGVFAAEDGPLKVSDDMRAVHQHIKKEHPSLPVIMFGHSMGGQLALYHLTRFPNSVKAAAIWNAPIVPPLAARVAKLVLGWERFRLGSDVPSRLMPALTFASWSRATDENRTASDWLSRDREEVDKYIMDPLSGWLPSVSMWRDIFDINLAIADKDAFEGVPRDLPLQIVGGEADPSTSNAKVTRKLAARLQDEGFSNIESRFYPDTRHETLNEINRDHATGDFIAWAKQACR